MTDARSPRPTPRRTRVSHACVACQQKKQKCDGQTPACRNCLRAGRVCVSQDPSSKRRHPRGYVEFLEQHNSSLENHVAYLERRLKENRSDIDLEDVFDHIPDDATQIHQQTTNAVSISRQAAHASTPRPPRTLESESPSSHGIQDEDDSNSLQILCLRAAGAEPHYFGASSAYSLTKIFSASLRTTRYQGPGLTLSGIPNQADGPPLSATPAPLPTRSIVRLLTAAYFEQVHPQFPFLHRPTYQTWEDGVLNAQENNQSANPIHEFFVYALCAIGTLTGPLAGNTLPEGLYAAAEALFDRVMSLNSLESIQAILACAMYSLRSPVGVSVWTLSGLALRQCLELGLHRKIRWTRAGVDHVRDEVRKRVFWCSYNLDRAVAITLGRPVGIADHDIDAELPLDLDDEHITTTELLGPVRLSHSDSPTNISSAIHTIRLRQLWARMQRTVYPQVGAESLTPSMSIMDDFRRDFEQWLERSPEQLSSNKTSNNAFGSKEWFTLMYHHSILLLYRHWLVRPGSATPAMIFTDCAHSSHAICVIYKQLYGRGRLNDTWGALHVLFLAGLTFLHCLWSSPETREEFRQDKVSSTCSSTLVVLAVMTERWAAVAPYRDSFEMLSNATQTMLLEVSRSSIMPHGPVISPGGQDEFTDYLAYMSEIGMCPSVEELLSTMIK